VSLVARCDSVLSCRRVQREYVKFIAALTQKLWYNMTSIVQYLAEKFTHFTAELPQLSEYKSEMSTLASRQKSWYQPRDSLASVWKFRPPHRNLIWHNSILISDILSVGHCMSILYHFFVFTRRWMPLSTTNMWTAWKFWPQLRNLIWRNYGNKVAQLYTHILSVGHCRSVSYHFFVFTLRWRMYM